MLFLLLFINIGCLVSIVYGDQISPKFNNGITVGSLSLNDPLDEASGLVASRKNTNILWIHEDGQNPFVYAININGTILGKYQVGTDGNDVEDIAIGLGPKNGVNYLYIGHIGDNNAIRSTIYIRRVPEPEVKQNQLYNEVNLTDVDTIVLQYPDGPKDAETLMVDTNGDIYIISKRLSSNKIYCAPYPQSTTEINPLELVVTLPEKTEFKWITAGDISLNGEWLILRNDQNNDYASIWHRKPGADLKQVFDNEHFIVDINDEPQGEAICYDPEGLGFYTVSEHAGYESIPIWYYQLSQTETNQEDKSNLNWLLIVFIFMMILLLVIFIITKNSMIRNIVFGVVIIISIGVYVSTNLLENDTIKTDNIENPKVVSQEELLTVTFNSTDYTFSLDGLISSYETISGFGTKINQIGKISETNKYTGIPICLMLESIDDLPDNYWLIASASDYEYNFSKENVSGKVELYDENSESYFMGNMTMILAYKINDKFLDETNGGPLRIVFIDDKGSITHSSIWVGSVNRLLVIKSEHNIIKNTLPVISINVSNNSGKAPITIYFSGNASDPDGYITSFKWDFGDGFSDDKKDTYHTYKKAGSYIASFMVTDNNGSNSTQTFQINISYLIVDGCVSPIDFNDPDTDWDNPEYAFDDNLDTLSRCTKTGFWRWRWTGYLELIPPSSLECNKIRFKAWYDSSWCNEIDIDLFFNNSWNDIYQGSYKNKEWETIEFPLNMVSKARVGFHLQQRLLGTDAELYEFDFYSETRNLPPVADFSFNPTIPNRNEIIYFSDESYDNDGIIVSWYWDFGDGIESFKINPTHAYSNFGYYEIKLTVTDDEGTANSVSKYISIGNQKPNADFSFTPVIPTLGNKVFFLDKSTDVDGYIMSWFWDFGDGSSSLEQNPNHQYTATGKYEVKLSVKDNDNGIDEIIKEIIINEQPKPDAILTIIYNGYQKTYTLEDLENMVYITGYGGRLNSIGVTAGPFEYKGVQISVLANEFSSIPASYSLTTISNDGYIYNYTQDEIQGNVQVYDKEGNKKEIGGVNMILAYEEEGIKDFPGGPLRIAYVDDEEQLTDSFLWSKSVIEIEFF